MASLAATVSLASNVASSSSLLVSHSKVFAGFDGLRACPVLQLKASRTMSAILRPLHTLKISCAASPETLSTVVEIVTTQLAAKDGVVQPQSKFTELGADSLDQVEIVMALEETFGITVDEDGAQSIETVQDAADIIEKIKGSAKAVA